MTTTMNTTKYISRAEVKRKYGLSAWHRVIKYRVEEHHREVSPDGSLTTIYYQLSDVVVLGLPDYDPRTPCPRCGAPIEQWGRHHSDYNEACSRACGYRYSLDSEEPLTAETIAAGERTREMIGLIGGFPKI